MVVASGQPTNPHHHHYVGAISTVFSLSLSLSPSLSPASTDCSSPESPPTPPGPGLQVQYLPIYKQSNDTKYLSTGLNATRSDIGPNTHSFIGFKSQQPDRPHSWPATNADSGRYAALLQLCRLASGCATGRLAVFVPGCVLSGDQPVSSPQLLFL